MKIQCPSCKRVFWETTDLYDPSKPPNGSMVKLLEPYKSNHWPVFGDGVMIATSNTHASEMDCPACLAQLAPSGRLQRAMEDDLKSIVSINPSSEEFADSVY